MLNILLPIYATITNTHLWCAAAGAVLMKVMSTTAAWAGWGQAAKVGEAVAAASSIVKTALTPAPPLPTTVAQMKAASMTAPAAATTTPAPHAKPATIGLVSKIETLFGGGAASSTLPATILADIGKLLVGIEAKIVSAVETALAAHLVQTPAPVVAAPPPNPVTTAPAAATPPAIVKSIVETGTATISSSTPAAVEAKI